MTTGMGLGEISDLTTLLGQPPQAAGERQMISISVIDEDPNQPRTVFDPQTMDELAKDVATRGIKSPISLRPHPEKAGRYVINHGARRYRAAIMAGLREVPYVLDKDYDRFDQVKENILRDALTPLEIATFIGGWLAEGLSQADIAKRLSKSKTFVSHHAGLLKLPEPLETVFHSGRCTDVTAIAELSSAFKEDEKAVTKWLQGPQEVSRESVKGLRQGLRAQQANVVPEPKSKGSATKGKTGATAAIANKPMLVVQWKRKQGVLLMSKRVKTSGHVWMRLDDGTELEVAPPFRVLAVIEG